MALRWHPYLVQFLRQDYGDRLIVEEEVSLGDMPLRADLVIIRRDPRVALPFPFNHLGAVTLVEYKGPDETASQDDLAQLEIYGLMYHRREKLGPRRNLTLWLAASRFAADVSQRDGAYLSRPRVLDGAIVTGTLDRFPACLVNLDALQVEPATLPLKMVAKGKREGALIEFLLEHHDEYRHYLRYVMDMHPHKLKEVLAMRRMKPEEIGLEFEPLVELARLFEDGEKRFIQAFDEDRLIAEIGEDRILQKMGEDRVRQWLRRKSAKSPTRPRRKPASQTGKTVIQ